MKSTKDILTKLGACTEAVKWAGRKTPKKAWETCKRGDWLLWIAGKLNVDRKLLVLVACVCARTALKYVPADEDRPRLAIEAAERWADNPTEKNKAAAWDAARAAAWAAGAAAWDAARAARAAGDAAWDAARAAAWAAGAAAWAAGDAAWAAAWAARAAGDAAWDAARAARAAGDAAWAAAWAARAAGDAAWDAARAAAWAAGAAGDAAHKDMAYIVRKIIPFSVICKAIADYEGKK